MALFAIMVMGGIAASAAQAEELFHSSVEKTTLTVTHDGLEGTEQANHKLTLAGSQVICKNFPAEADAQQHTFTSIQYTATGIACPKQGQASGGTYEGNAIATGEASTSMTKVWWE